MTSGTGDAFEGNISQSNRQESPDLSIRSPLGRRRRRSGDFHHSTWTGLSMPSRISRRSASRMRAAGEQVPVFARPERRNWRASRVRRRGPAIERSLPVGGKILPASEEGGELLLPTGGIRCGGTSCPAPRIVTQRETKKACPPARIAPSATALDAAQLSHRNRSERKPRYRKLGASSQEESHGSDSNLSRDGAC